MKFAVDSVAKSGARIGCLTDFSRIPQASFETPLLLLHTRGGSVPHLSYDILQMVTKEHHIFQTPLVTLIDSTESIKALGKGLAEFTGLKEYLNFATVQDSGTSTPQGYHDKKSVSLWTRGGRKLIDPHIYMSSIEILKPDIYQLLADGDATMDSSLKRLKKSVDATVNFAEQCHSFRKKSEVLKDTPVFASIVGGYNMSERLRCIKSLNEFEVSGYILDGFHTNGDSATNLKWEDVEPVLTDTLAALSNNNPRVFLGALEPLTVLKMVSKGIDIFDATYPWTVAERGGALTFPNSIHPIISQTNQVTETLPNINEMPSGNKKSRNDETEAIITRTARCYEISLKDKKFFDDFQPLADTCDCYCCRKYSRAYVHHLMTTGELLGPLLLMMHNLHHYLTFFRNIRLAIKDNQLEAFEKRLQDSTN